jgi:hypothetical protein
LATGTYVTPFITPTDFSREAIIIEMHAECVKEERLKRQEAPYRCYRCGDPISNEAQIIYGVVGRKPNDPWIRPEDRGYELYFVSHVRCWEGKLA